MGRAGVDDVYKGGAGDHAVGGCLEAGADVVGRLSFSRPLPYKQETDRRTSRQIKKKSYQPRLLLVLIVPYKSNIGSSTRWKRK